ncbi:MAG TPA: twin-arginine translocase TatA/TatE family subunit [Candidatus Methylacidiphilales bacterium]|nr:twin-arginine translocase TatA/TatE family subunit [Candidatus Methylacidiphilales bacterium]
MAHPLFALGLPPGMDWFWIFLVVVILFGADKIPKLARGLGKSVSEFKKAKEEFDKEVSAAATESEVKKIEDKPATSVNSVSAETTKKI